MLTCSGLTFLIGTWFLRKSHYPSKQVWFLIVKAWLRGPEHYAQQMQIEILCRLAVSMSRYSSFEIKLFRRTWKYHSLARISSRKSRRQFHFRHTNLPSGWETSGMKYPVRESFTAITYAYLRCPRPQDKEGCNLLKSCFPEFRRDVFYA